MGAESFSQRFVTFVKGKNESPDGEQSSQWVKKKNNVRKVKNHKQQDLPRKVSSI